MYLPRLDAQARLERHLHRVSRRIHQHNNKAILPLQNRKRIIKGVGEFTPPLSCNDGSIFADGRGLEEGEEGPVDAGDVAGAVADDVALGLGEEEEHREEVGGV